MLLKIDGWIIDKFESFSHWTQRWLGIASPSWERFFLVLCILQFAVLEIPHDMGRSWTVIFMDGFLMSHFVGRFVVSLLRTPPSRIGDEAVRNPNKIDPSEYVGRMIILPMALMFAPFTVKALTMNGNPHLWMQCFAAACVFAACDDLPHSASKIREWLKSWNFRPAPAPQLVKVKA